MNFVYRIEDDDFNKLDLQSLNISMFSYNKEFLDRYIESNIKKKNQLHNYIIERMRNALMHGNINIAVNKKNQVIIIFSDIYNNREEKIEISLEDLKIFFLQDSIYDGILKETEVMILK